MKLHANARLSVKGRELLVDRMLMQGWSLALAAEAAGVSDRTVCKWVARFRVEGEQGLLDRSSVPKNSPSRTPEERVQVIAALRRLRMTGAEIAECLGMAVTTVSGILTRIGMGKLGRLGMEPAVRYERTCPGELIHVDVKKLGRIARPGWRVTGGKSSRGVAGYNSKAHKPRPRSASCAAPLPSMPRMASASENSSRTTAAPTARASTLSPVVR
jgi:transposase